MPKRIRAEDQYCKHLGLLLKRIRGERGVRQVDVAAALGKNQSFVSKYEAGRAELSVGDLFTVLTLFDVSFAEFSLRLERILIRHTQYLSGRD